MFSLSKHYKHYIHALKFLVEVGLHCQSSTSLSDHRFETCIIYFRRRRATTFLLELSRCNINSSRKYFRCQYRIAVWSFHETARRRPEKEYVNYFGRSLEQNRRILNINISRSSHEPPPFLARKHTTRSWISMK